MQIRMKFKGTLRSNESRKGFSGMNGHNNGNGNGSSTHICSDCKVTLVRQQMQFVCPKCGLVEEFIEGSE